MVFKWSFSDQPKDIILHVIWSHCSEVAADCHLTNWNCTALLAVGRLQGNLPLCISIRLANTMWVSINMGKVVSYKTYPINPWRVWDNEIMEDININFIFLQDLFHKVHNIVKQTHTYTFIHSLLNWG